MNNVSRYACVSRGFVAVLLVACVVLQPALADKGEDQFNFATGLFIDNDYEMAAQEYSGLLAQYPKHKLAARAQFQLGECLTKLERYKEAIAPLTAYVARPDAEPDRLAAAYFRLGRAHTELKAFDSAAASYKAALDKFPQHARAPSARYWFAQCRLNAAKHTEAKAAFEATLKTDKGGTYEPYSLYGLGLAFFHLKAYQEAAGRMEEVLKRFPKEEFAPQATLRLAQCYEALEKTDKALQTYERLEKTFGKELGVEARMGRGQALFRKGELEKAIPIFLTVARDSPEHALADTARYNAGCALFNVGKYGEALPLFEALVKGKGKQAAPSLYWQGMCLLKLDRAADAMAPLTAAAAGADAARAYFAQGDAHLALKDPAKAQKAYETVADKFPKDDIADEALQAAAAVAAERGAYDEAARLGQRLVTAYPNSPLAGEGRFLAAEALYRKEDYAGAAAGFKALLDKPPKTVGQDVLLYKLAWCAYRQKDSKNALDLFQRLAREQPKSTLAGESLLMAGKIETAAGRHKEARALYEQSFKSYPDSPAAEKAFYARGLAEFSMQDWKTAAASLGEFLKARPKSELVPNAWFYLGESQFALKDFDAAQAAYRACMKAAPAGETVPQALHGLAWCQKEKKQLDVAAATFEQLAAKHPKSKLAAEGLYWAGRCRMGLGKTAEARALLARVAAATGAETVAGDAAYYTANCLLTEKSYDKAIAAYEQFKKKFPKSPRYANAIYDMGWCYIGKKDDAKATAMFRQASEKTDQPAVKADSLFRVAQALYDQEKYAEAAALYGQVAAIPGVAFLDKVHYKLGWSLEKQEKWQEAQKAFAKVAVAGELGGDAAFRAGRMLQQMGQHKEAEAAFVALLRQKGLDKELATKAKFQRAEALRALLKWPEGLKAYRELAKPGGFEPAYHVQYGIGVCALEVGAYADAQRAFDLTIEQTETETAARAQLGLGEIFYRQGKFPEAAKGFLKVYYLYGYPKWKAQGLLRAAQSFDKAGRKARATQDLKKLIEKFPDSDAAQEAKKLLGS